MLTGKRHSGQILGSGTRANGNVATLWLHQFLITFDNRCELKRRVGQSFIEEFARFKLNHTFFQFCWHLTIDECITNRLCDVLKVLCHCSAFENSDARQTIDAV
jgi:hypothetical protein